MRVPQDGGPVRDGRAVVIASPLLLTDGGMTGDGVTRFGKSPQVVSADGQA